MRASVVVGVDCSVHSTEVIRAAVGVAEQLDTDVEALFVYPRMVFEAVTPDRSANGEYEGVLRDCLDATVRRALAPGGVPERLSMQVSVADPAKLLVERSRDALLLVVGNGEHNALSSIALGSVAAKCVAHSRCAVLVVHGSEEAVIEPSSPLVVGFDGSPGAAHALRWATALVHGTDRPVEAVYCWERPSYFSSTGMAYAPGEPSTEELMRIVNEHVDAALPYERPVNLHVALEEGAATAVLLARSALGGLVVLGTRGRGGFASLLLGSVSATCVNHATSPVLVVPAGAPTPARGTAAAVRSA